MTILSILILGLIASMYSSTAAIHTSHELSGGMTWAFVRSLVIQDASERRISEGSKISIDEEDEGHV